MPGAFAKLLYVNISHGCTYRDSTHTRVLVADQWEQ